MLEADGCSTSAPPTCSACRPSTPITASAPSATACSPATSPVSRVLSDLLPVIDDMRARAQHGDLTGPLKAVADKLDAVTTKQGLVAFGAVGDPFDPAIHEAVMHDESTRTC